MTHQAYQTVQGETYCLKKSKKTRQILIVTLGTWFFGANVETLFFWHDLWATSKSYLIFFWRNSLIYFTLNFFHFTLWRIIILNFDFLAENILLFKLKSQEIFLIWNSAAQQFFNFPGENIILFKLKAQENFRIAAQQFFKTYRFHFISNSLTN